MTRGYVWGSQTIRRKIIDGNILIKNSNLALDDKGKFRDENLEKLVQPTSHDPIIGDEAFILDSEIGGIFRPRRNESVYKTLLQLPSKRRIRKNISDGFEVNQRFSYLVHLEQKVKLSNELVIRSSTKSSFGRIFLNARMFSDYNTCFNEINNPSPNGDPLDLWLMLQPLKFNLIFYPGLCINQLRFLYGDDVCLSSSEIKNEFSKEPLLYTKSNDGKLESITPVISPEGLQVSLNLLGNDTHGIIGFRARSTPESIDLKKVGNYDIEDFFEPCVVKDGSFVFKGEECYLFSTAEILNTPKHLAFELETRSDVGFRGELHFAGFIDNGFKGDLILEVVSSELTDMIWYHGMPVGKLKIFNTEIPDKLYGEAIGSNYFGQTGPRPAKFFKKIDYAYVAREYEKLQKHVLVQDAKLVKRHRKILEGFEFVDNFTIDNLLEDVSNGFFQQRYDCENDELLLQLIPYVLLFGKDKNVFSYVRAKDIKNYGDQRLFGKHSIGVGGHINPCDGPNYLIKGLNRELEQEVDIIGSYREPRLVGTLFVSDKAVDRVHLGMIYKIHVNGSVTPKEAALVSGKMIPISELVSDKLDNKYETWTRILIPKLDEIYKK